MLISASQRPSGSTMDVGFTIWPNAAGRFGGHACYRVHLTQIGRGRAALSGKQRLLCWRLALWDGKTAAPEPKLIRDGRAGPRPARPVSKALQPRRCGCTPDSPANRSGPTRTAAQSRRQQAGKAERKPADPQRQTQPSPHHADAQQISPS